jgi:hypothetical protein
LIYEGVAWGGQTLTVTDIALAKEVMIIEDARCDPRRVKTMIPDELIEKTYKKWLKC